MNDHNPGLLSPLYLDVILRGGIQSGLRKEYVEMLRQFKGIWYFDECHVYEKCVNGLPPEEKLNFQLFILRNWYQLKM